MTDVGPFKCPDCGTWWAAPYEHRCPPMQGVLSMNTQPTVTPRMYSTGANNVVMCTCPPDRGDMYAGSCPIHDVQSTLTRWPA